MLLQKAPFILLCHRRELMQIADHKQLHPAKGQLKKRMECYPAGVDSRNTGWSSDNHPLHRVLMQIMEKSCFACACFARQKNIAASVLNKVVGKLQFMVCGGHGFPDHERYYRFILRMIRIVLQKFKIIINYFLDRRWKFIKAFPKSRTRSMHLQGL